jgi:predicted metal-dependent hydrolase
LTHAERREQDLVLERLRRDAAELVRAFGLTAGSIDAERPRVRRRYGVCDSRGNIRIRLRHATTGRLLKYSSLVDTLCHELAHLRYLSHGPRFRALYLRILESARRRGIYRPKPRGAPPVTWAAPAERLVAAQLDLFRG